MRGEDASSGPPAHPPPGMQFRGGAPSADRFQGCRCGRRRRARRRPSLGGSRDPSATSGPRRPRRDSARNMPSAGPEEEAVTAQTARPQPRGGHTSTRAIASRLGKGGRQRRLETASPEPAGPRGLQRPAAAQAGGRFRERSGPRFRQARAGSDPARERRGIGSDRLNECRDLGRFPRQRGSGGCRLRPSAFVDIRREANLSCYVARLSSVRRWCRSESQSPAEHSMRPCHTGDSRCRLRRPAGSSTDWLLSRPETHPRTSKRGPQPGVTDCQ